MRVSQKCQYALRAIFELAKRPGAEPVSTTQIAAAQAIPKGFLEVILVQLKNGGFVRSRRGMRGGYQLTASAQTLTLGEIIRFVDGPIAPIDCMTNPKPSDCGLNGDCTFMPFWERVRDAVADVYETTTFQDLIDSEQAACQRHLGSNI